MRCESGEDVRRESDFESALLMSSDSSFTLALSFSSPSPCGGGVFVTETDLLVNERTDLPSMVSAAPSALSTASSKDSCSPLYTTISINSKHDSNENQFMLCDTSTHRHKGLANSFVGFGILYLGSSWPPMMASASVPPDGQERQRRCPAATYYLCIAPGAFDIEW